MYDEQPHTVTPTHFADAVNQSMQSIVKVDQSELSVESVRYEVAKVRGCSWSCMLEIEYNILHALLEVTNI